MKNIILFIILALLSSGPSFGGQTGELRVQFMDVGEGDAILVKTPSGKTLLIDGGNSGKEEVIRNYLNKSGIKERIDMIILSHPLEDHVGGLVGIIEDLDIGSIYDPGMPLSTYIYEKFLELIMTKQDQYGETGSSENKLSDVLAKKMHYEFFNPKAGDILSLDPDCELAVLSPRMLFHNTRSDPNNNSLVVKLVYNQVSFLFPGDVELDAEKYLITQGSKISATFLKVPNHGSPNSSSLPFINLVKPKVSVISAGKDNPYGYPSLQILERLKKAGSKIYRTDLNGSILVTSDGNRYTVEPEKATEDTFIVAQTYSVQKTNASDENQTVSEKKININSATADDLIDIPGVGAFKAQMIVRYREKNGNFKSPEDLEKVPGLNKAIVDKLKEKISF
ncbi:MAG: helix-hairpin-helix domain-containing protein [bacterium]|nr:helix-hairpin-helix domain-containing protein [bacterium]